VVWGRGPPQRTTQGVWVDLDEALPKHTLPMVVLDMEGA
jgi:hypothetical protein